MSEHQEPSEFPERGASRGGRLGEIWAYLRTRKRWWLLPTLLILVVMGLFITFAEGSVALPFIYTLF